MPFSSKFRHIFGDVPKPQFQFLDIKKPYTSGEGNYCDANADYFAVSKAGGGGPLYVFAHNKPGRQSADCPVVNVHKGKALDFQFHPFIKSLLATASEDTKVCVTEIPDGGLTANVTTPAVTLSGHQKKTHLLKWHPTANNIIATSSWDKTVKLWNVETSECVQTYQNAKEVAFSMDWNADGSLLGITTKEKLVRLFDARAPETDAGNFKCMQGSKSSKLFWIPNYNWIGATGFTKQAKRKLRVWDLKNTDKPIFEWVVDQQSSVLMPKYDPDTHLLFLAGKGDGSVFFNELVNDKRIVYQMGVYRDTEPQKGGGWVPKRGLDTKKCEIMRFMKLTRSAVVPVSFVVPRKTGAEIFQSDIYPDAIAGVPSLSADEYLGGANKPPITTSMDPEKRAGADDGGAVFVKKKTYSELAAENDELKQRIADLEKQLKEISGE